MGHLVPRPPPPHMISIVHCTGRGAGACHHPDRGGVRQQRQEVPGPGAGHRHHYRGYQVTGSTSFHPLADSASSSIASCYSDQSSFRTRRGSLTLNNLHHSSTVSVYEEGRLVMKGLDGSTQVFVKRGGIDLQVSRVRAQSRVELGQGDILLKLTDSHPLKVGEVFQLVPDPPPS